MPKSTSGKDCHAGKIMRGEMPVQLVSLISYPPAMWHTNNFSFEDATLQHPVLQTALLDFQWFKTRPSKRTILSIQELVPLHRAVTSRGDDVGMDFLPRSNAWKYRRKNKSMGKQGASFLSTRCLTFYGLYGLVYHIPA